MSLEEGIGLFNSGRYFEAHEAWEVPWRPAPKGSPEKLFIQGLIMVSAALDHYRKKEYAGTAKLLEKGQRLLREHKYLGKDIDMEDFLRQVGSFHERFKAQGEGIPEDEFPKIRRTREK
jgi:predicted metal-dependent hydrolase